MSDKNERIKAIVALTTISFFVSIAVVFSYMMTKPYIERAANEAAYIAMESVLPNVDKFEEIEVPKEILERYGCNFIRKAADSAEMAIQIQGIGYQEGLVVMVGIDMTKKIAGIKIVQHGETEGIGTRAMNDQYLSNYLGLNSTDGVEIISGATYTSKGIKNAVQNALDLYEYIGEELKVEGKIKDIY